MKSTWTDLSFFSAFKKRDVFMGYLGQTIFYMPYAWSVILSTIVNIITSFLSFGYFSYDLDKYRREHKNKLENYKIDKIIVIFFILSILMIVLYSIISEKIIDKNKQESDININIVYFSSSIILLFLNLIYIIYAIKK